MTTSEKIWLAGLTIFLIGAFLFLMTLGPEPSEQSTNPLHQDDSLKFNSTQWKDSVDYVEAVRPYMLDDLRRNVLVIGMERKDIESLLGESLPRDKEGKYLYYRIGIFEGMEPTYLVIELDDNDRFKTSSLHDY
jgi:hypothetical protein